MREAPAILETVKNYVDKWEVDANHIVKLLRHPCIEIIHLTIKNQVHSQKEKTATPLLFVPELCSGQSKPNHRFFPLTRVASQSVFALLDTPR